MSAEYPRICAFLYREARHLDDREWEPWLQLYALDVEYWMPFDDQIGLHDSSWRTEYGGDIYLTDGSHGCVNTPLDAIATIYNNITVGTLVVVY